MKSERLTIHELPHWIPKVIQEPLKEAVQKESIDLTSELTRERHLVNNNEFSDVTSFLKQFKSTVFVGMSGSRVAQRRNRLFESLDEFDAYYKTGKKYLFPPEQIIRARKHFEEKSFNDEYIDGKKFPADIVNVLVRDIDLLIFDGETTLPSGVYQGKKSNVLLDVTICKPSTQFTVDADDFLSLSIKRAVTLKY